jgi:NTP pyrophosphatase (non-canonical NTP hydrolase)
VLATGCGSYSRTSRPQSQTRHRRTAVGHRAVTSATRETDQRVGHDLLDITVHLLGLLGEAGSVATEYKKHLRDGDAHTAWKSRMREELGDVLWYAATLASKLDLNLDDIAAANLHKTRDRWLRSDTDPFDAHYPEQERLPLHAQLEFVPDTDDPPSRSSGAIDGAVTD